MKEKKRERPAKEGTKESFSLCECGQTSQQRERGLFFLVPPPRLSFSPPLSRTDTRHHSANQPISFTHFLLSFPHLPARPTLDFCPNPLTHTPFKNSTHTLRSSTIKNGQLPTGVEHNGRKTQKKALYVPHPCLALAAQGFAPSAIFKRPISNSSTSSLLAVSTICDFSLASSSAA